ncbi:Putative membrane protein [Hyphomicrobiales bacterium]|nr:putative membrane protein [Hyphomicrobiales bacterium]CAH1664585.1 Putative membrane protein [Hyphomicrobiales bacterium]
MPGVRPMSILNSLRARPRIIIFLAIIVGLAAVLPHTLPLSSRLLIAWDCGALVYLCLVVRMAFTADVAVMRRRAAVEDDGAIAILMFTIFASVMSLVAIVVEFSNVGNLAPTIRNLHIALATVTILFSWLIVHISFALHYAHEYYAREKSHPGIRFPSSGKSEDFQPDYWDFMYFSANLGAAAQTSDVMIESRRIRRIVLCHTVLSFLFNTAILAMGVNIAAGVI